MKPKYFKQVNLLIDILSILSNYPDMALHGGSAINFFLDNMPRLSVDIDLTYVHFSDRNQALQSIAINLKQIRLSIIDSFGNVRVEMPKIENDEYKLYCSRGGSTVKLEVNTINRGILGDVQVLQISQNAQNIFEKFCEARIVSNQQLFGGKIVAALDRQHPRDIFDVKKILDKINLADIKDGILLLLLSSKRPLHELLQPNPLDMEKTFENQFEGMTNEMFSYDDYLAVRENLILSVNEIINEVDKQFLTDFFDGNPDWNIYDFENYPAIKWKLKNVKKLKINNPPKHNFHQKLLKKALKV